MQVLAPYRLVIFDCDGTLVDSQANIVAAMRRAFAAHGHAAPAAADIRRQVGLTLEILVARLSPGIAPATACEIAETYRGIIRGQRSDGSLSEPLFDGIHDLIRDLDHPALFLGVATGKNMVGLEHTLAHHGLRDRFHTLQTADRAISKPHPDMVLKAMAACACDPHETVVVGDTSFDMEMARAAGATAIGVAWGYHPPADLMATGAAAVIDHPRDFIPRLQSLSSSR